MACPCCWGLPAWMAGDFRWLYWSVLLQGRTPTTLSVTGCSTCNLYHLKKVVFELVVDYSNVPAPCSLQPSQPSRLSLPISRRSSGSSGENGVSSITFWCLSGWSIPFQNRCIVFPWLSARIWNSIWWGDWMYFRYKRSHCQGIHGIPEFCTTERKNQFFNMFNKPHAFPPLPQRLWSSPEDQFPSQFRGLSARPRFFR